MHSHPAFKVVHRACFFMPTLTIEGRRSPHCPGPVLPRLSPKKCGIPDEKIDAIKEVFDFYAWETVYNTHSVVRRLTSWATREDKMDAFIQSNNSRKPVQMKVLSVLGSPNREGNTARLLQEYLWGVEASHEEIELSSLFVQEKQIAPCKGCNACKTGLFKTCVIKDDMHDDYRIIEAADVIILASPVYWFNMTALAKATAFIDRLYGMNDENLPQGKKMALLTTFYASPAATSGAVNISNRMKSICDFLNIQFTHDLGVCSATPVKDNNDARHQAFSLGKQLCTDSKGIDSRATKVKKQKTKNPATPSYPGCCGALL